MNLIMKKASGVRHQASGIRHQEELLEKYTGCLPFGSASPDA